MGRPALSIVFVCLLGLLSCEPARERESKTEVEELEARVQALEEEMEQRRRQEITWETNWQPIPLKPESYLPLEALKSGDSPAFETEWRLAGIREDLETGHKYLLHRCRFKFVYDGVETTKTLEDEVLMNRTLRPTGISVSCIPLDPDRSRSAEEGEDIIEYLDRLRSGREYPMHHILECSCDLVDVDGMTYRRGTLGPRAVGYLPGHTKRESDDG